MKRTLVIATLIATAWMFNAVAQNGGDQGGNAQGGGQGGSGGHHKRPSPDQMAKDLMSKFDANKDGKLSQDELTQAVTALEEHRPQGPGGGGQGQHQGANQNGQASTGQGVQGGQHQEPPSADKVAAHMIENFSSDKKGLTEAELAKAIAAHLANRGQHGGGQPGNGGGQQGHGGQQGGNAGNGSN